MVFGLLRQPFCCATKNRLLQGTFRYEQEGCRSGLFKSNHRLYLKQMIDKCFSIKGVV